MGRVLAALAGAIFLFSTPAHAGEAERRAYAAEIVELLDIGAAANRIFVLMEPMIRAELTRNGQMSETAAARLSAILVEEFAGAGPEISAAVAIGFAEGMAEDHLLATRDFLRTPAGRAWIESQHGMQQVIEREGRRLGVQIATRALARFANEQLNP